MAQQALTKFRKDRGLSLSDACAELGMRSRGQLHDIESGRVRPSLKLALKIERWSGGEIRAAELCPDAADLLPTAEASAP